MLQDDCSSRKIEDIIISGSLKAIKTDLIFPESLHF